MGIAPFNYQKRTNIEEHNQIVDKLNEVVDAVNNIDPSGQGLEPRVTALETDVTDLGARVDSVESKNTQQDTEISNIKTDAETTRNRLGAAEGDITTLTGQVNQLETDTTSLDGRVTDIDGRLTTLAGNYTTLGGRVDSINTEVGQLSTEIGGLETGKVNTDQGVANAGKVLGIGSDGRVTPVEQSGGGGGGSITVDSALNAESTNPVENSAIVSALANKLDNTATQKSIMVANSNGSIIACKIAEVPMTLNISAMNVTRTIDGVEYNMYSIQTSLPGSSIGPFSIEALKLTINDVTYDVVKWYYYKTTFDTHLPSSIKCEIIAQASTNRVVGNIYIPTSTEVTSIRGTVTVGCIKW